MEARQKAGKLVGHALFAYGTLMFGDIRAAVTGRRLRPEKAVLPDYRRQRIGDLAVPAVQPWVGEAVEGLVLFGLDRSILARIDDYEGDLYERQLVRIGSRGGGRLAYCYVASARARALLGEEWSPQVFARRDKADYVRRQLRSNVRRKRSA